MKVAITLLLVLCIGCREKQLRQSTINAIHDTCRLSVDSSNQSLSMSSTQLEAPTGWCFAYGTMHGDTTFVEVTHGSTLAAYKKNSRDWIIVDSALWKRFLDTIEIIKTDKQSDKNAILPSTPVGHYPPGRCAGSITHYSDTQWLGSISYSNDDFWEQKAATKPTMFGAGEPAVFGGDSAFHWDTTGIRLLIGDPRDSIGKRPWIIGDTVKPLSKLSRQWFPAEIETGEWKKRDTIYVDMCIHQKNASIDKDFYKDVWTDYILVMFNMEIIRTERLSSFYTNDWIPKTKEDSL